MPVACSESDRAFLRCGALHRQVDLLPFHRRKPTLASNVAECELRLRLLRLLQELLGARAFLGAAAGEEKRRADDDGEKPNHGSGIGTGH